MLLCRHAGGGPVDEGADRAGRRAPLRRPRHRGGLAAPDRGGGRQRQQLGGAVPLRFEGPAHPGDLHLPPAPPARAADSADRRAAPRRPPLVGRVPATGGHGAERAARQPLPQLHRHAPAARPPRCVPAPAGGTPGVDAHLPRAARLPSKSRPRAAPHPPHRPGHDIHRPRRRQPGTGPGQRPARPALRRRGHRPHRRHGRLPRSPGVPGRPHRPRRHRPGQPDLADVPVTDPSEGTMSVDLSSAVAVITGAGSGIGRATARSLARRGARVVVTDIDPDRATVVAAELGEQAAAARCDVTSIADLEAARDLARDRFGRIDVVMNNVGILAIGAVEDIPLEAWQRIIDVNLLGVVRSNLVFLPGLIKQGSGHIVNTASTAGLLPYGFDRLPYTATKHAVVGLSESLAVYLRPRGIGVTCLCPAGVATNIREQITVYGDPRPPRSPSFPIVDADSVGELVAGAIEADRFLVLTAPEAAGELRERAADMDAYLARMSTEYQ